MVFWKTASKRAGSYYPKIVYAEDIDSLWERHNVTAYFEGKYKEEIENDFNFDNFEGEETENFDDDSYLSEYIGTVFSLYPSGKYWTFWACGNMSMKEMVKDSIFTEVLNEVVGDHGFWIEPGEGDPCDLFLCKSID